MTFRAGIVGCGRIGCEFDDDPKRQTVATHAGAYNATEQVRLVALADLDSNKLARAGKRWQVTALYSDYREMLRQEALDILSICTWNSTHAEIVGEAVRHGVKAIYCEKPIADTLQNADEMIRLCKEKGVILQINHQRRFDPFHQEIRHFLQQGKLGRVQQVTFYYTSGIANTGSHVFDLLRFFFGDVAWVRAVPSQNVSPNPNDPNLDGMMLFRNVAFCAIQACDVREFLIAEMDCIGSKGRLRLNLNSRDLEFYEVGNSPNYSNYRELRPNETPIKNDTPRNYMVHGVRNLVECLRQEKESISRGEDGRASLELICAFHESVAGDGKKVTLPLLESKIAVKSH